MRRVKAIFGENKDNSPPIPKTVLTEAWDSSLNFPIELAKLILQFIVGDFDTTHKAIYDYSTFKLLEHSLQQIKVLAAQNLAHRAAINMLLGNRVTVLELVRSNPIILECRIPEVLEPVKRAFTISVQLHLYKYEPNTPAQTIFNRHPIVRYKNMPLLAIAIAEGFFNYSTTINYGLINEFISYLSPQELRAQVREYVPTNFQEITKTRLKPFLDAIKSFIVSVQAMQFPENATFATIAKKGELYRTVCSFHEELFRIDSLPVEKGLRLPPTLLSQAWELIRQAFWRPAGHNRVKADLCAIVICGSLSALSPAGEVQLYKEGLWDLFQTENTSSSSRSVTFDKYYGSKLGFSCLYCSKQGRKISTVANMNIEDEIIYLNKLVEASGKIILSLMQTESFIQVTPARVNRPHGSILSFLPIFRLKAPRVDRSQANILVKAFETDLEEFLAYNVYSADTCQQIILLIHITECMGNKDRLPPKISAVLNDPEYFNTLIIGELKDLIEQHQQAFDWLKVELGMEQPTVSYGI